MRRALGICVMLAAPTIAAGNDFPTQARVEFVLGCMNEQGGQTYDTLYKCVCLVDAIAAEMTHEEFAQAQVFSQLRSTAGERGGVFRDPDQAQALVEKLEGALERGKASCFVGGQARGQAPIAGSRQLADSAAKSVPDPEPDP